MIDSISSYPFIELQLIDPQLIKFKTEQSILKKLLNKTYNEGDTSIIKVIGKYIVNTINENWFYILIIVFIFITFIKIKKKDKDKDKYISIKKIHYH
jgi:hypothetical protein